MTWYLPVYPDTGQGAEGTGGLRARAHERERARAQNRICAKPKCQETETVQLSTWWNLHSQNFRNLSFKAEQNMRRVKRKIREK